MNSPIYTSTSYEFIDRDGPVYPRYLNTPNEQAVAEKIAALEETESALVFSSGMAAISTTLFTFLKKGDHAVFQKGLYGGTSHFLFRELNRFGIDFTVAKSQQVHDLEKVILPETKIIYIETPSNPLLNITDIQAVSEMARGKRILTVIDNTFASPVNQQPARLGMDIVIHSATKYLSGHSDICAGAVASGKSMIEQIHATGLNFGGSLNGITLYLLERSMKTLDVRIKRINENALHIAKFLSTHQRVKRVNYPGLPEHQGHDIAAKQMKGFGGMLSFEVNGIDCLEYQKKLKLIKPSISLGGLETIVSSPAHTSHRHLGTAGRKKEGIPEGLIRMSVGIEDADDLKNDLDQAFG
ncbi:MAG TPA: aminotransferase class I/II-fold pyridoxal phosphate-dependent enzyme [Bacteroidaceae bacterium]|nr:aminotransferase class I/II-fold pyridoxal phosphate-dependent enzyme [Bacteroidaceae bacterium]